MKRSSLLLGAFCALAIGASSVQAQNKLTTIFASNNGGSVGGIVYFDVTVSSAVIINAFETNCDQAASTPIGLDVYTIPNTYVGSEGSQSGWTMVATDDGKAVSAGSGDVASLVNLQAPLTLTPGKYGVALVAKSFGHDYTNGSGTNQQFKDNFLQLDLGAAYNTPWGSTSPFTPRVWNGSVIYNPANGIYSNFSATPVEGKSPLKVQFTDKTYTSDPNGVTKWEWDFNGDQIVDSTVQNPIFVFTGVGYDVKYSVSLKTTDGTNGSSTITKKDYIVVNPFPVASATAFGAGSKVPATADPVQMPAYTSTYSYSQGVRGFWAQAPVTFTITGFDVPNEQNATHQSVWFFIYPGATAPSTYAVTAADTKFIGSGPVGTSLTPTGGPIVVQQGQWFGCMGTCHDATGTTMHNSYGNSTTTTVLGQPMLVQRLTHTGNLVGHSGTGSVSQSTSPIGRVLMNVPGNTVAPSLAASGDTPYFGGNPQLDMSANMPGAQAGILFASLQDLPTAIPTPFGNLLVVPNFLLSVVVPNGTGSVNLPIPNDPNFADAHIFWQGVAFDLTNNINGMTNGVDWRIGQQ